MPALAGHLPRPPEASPTETAVSGAVRMSALIRRAPPCQLPDPVLPAVLVARGPAGRWVRVPGPPVAGFGPFLAAAIVLGVTQGRSGVGRLIRSMVKWRVPARAYVAALTVPPLVSGSAS